MENYKSAPNGKQDSIFTAVLANPVAKITKNLLLRKGRKWSMKNEILPINFAQHYIE